MGVACHKQDGRADPVSGAFRAVTRFVVEAKLHFVAHHVELAKERAIPPIALRGKNRLCGGRLPLQAVFLPEYASGRAAAASRVVVDAVSKPDKPSAFNLDLHRSGNEVAVGVVGRRAQEGKSMFCGAIWYGPSMRSLAAMPICRGSITSVSHSTRLGRLWYGQKPNLPRTAHRFLVTENTTPSQLSAGSSRGLGSLQRCRSGERRSAMPHRRQLRKVW